MPTLYGVSISPFTRKVRAVLSAGSIPYEHNPITPMQVDEDYKKNIHPLGKIPAFKDGELIIPDSSAICAYLEKKYKKTNFYPDDAADYAKALWLEEFADTALANAVLPIFFQRIVISKFLKKPVDESVIQSTKSELQPPVFDYLESQLTGDNTIVGKHMSIADIAITSLFINYQMAGEEVDAKRWPKLAAYIKANIEKPIFKKLIDEEMKVFK